MTKEKAFKIRLMILVPVIILWCDYIFGKEIFTISKYALVILNISSYLISLLELKHDKTDIFKRFITTTVFHGGMMFTYC